MSDKKKLSTENIQKALKESKLRKSDPNVDESSNDVEGEATTETSKCPRLSDEERAARDEAKQKELAAKREAREIEKAQRAEAKALAKANKVPHMAKVDKQAKNLPPLSSGAQSLVTDILTKYDETEITTIVAYLNHLLRARATANASKVVLQEGQLVRIVTADGPNSRWVGHLANVVTAQRIRCYVQPVGTAKKVYLFSSNVRPLSEDEISALPEDTQEPISRSA